MIIQSRNLIQTKEKPPFNEPGFIETTGFGTTQPFSYTHLIELVKKSPEVVGILHAIQTDICSDGFAFEGKKSKVEKAELFIKENRFRSEFSGVILDWLALGNGALWKGKIEEKKVKEVLKKLQVTTGIEFKEHEIKAMMTSDEDVYKTKLLKHAPWSTMNIDLTKDKTSISRFRLLLADSTKEITFQPKEIIHGKFMHFDGKVYGFSPLESGINVVSTLLLIKDLNGSFFQNGGVPDWMFILPKEQANSPNVKKLQQVLKKYKNSRSKHGNLVFTGEVEREQLNKFDKDMEFRQMAIYYTGIIALAFNMPMARVAAIIGSEVKSGAATTDLSEAGYWRGISTYQDYWEDLLNTQLFEPEFGVSIKFNRGYLNDEIKEAQRDVQMFQVIDQLIQREAVTKDYAQLKLKIPDRFWTGKWKIPEPTMSSPFGGAGGSPGSPPKKDQKGDARQANAERKKTEATKAVERKEKPMEIGLDEFMVLFERWVKNSNTRMVNHFIEGDNFNFIIHTPDESFKLTIGRTQMPEPLLIDLLTFGRRINAS